MGGQAITHERRRHAAETSRRPAIITHLTARCRSRARNTVIRPRGTWRFCEKNYFFTFFFIPISVRSHRQLSRHSRKTRPRREGTPLKTLLKFSFAGNPPALYLTTPKIARNIYIYIWCEVRLNYQIFTIRLTRTPPT